MLNRIAGYALGISIGCVIGFWACWVDAMDFKSSKLYDCAHYQMNNYGLEIEQAYINCANELFPE